MIEISGVEELKRYVGKHLGYSSWHNLSQELIDQFAELTGDRQWIHVDPEAAKNGPFGTTIAHGYLILSLVPELLPEVLSINQVGIAVNYGSDKIRFPSPVPSDSKIRLGATVRAVEEFQGGIQVTVEATIETENASKPSLVAQLLYRFYR